MTTSGHPIWDRWEEIDSLLDRLLDEDAGERASQLERIRAGDPDLASTLDDLLAAADASEAIADGPTPGVIGAALDAAAPPDPLPARIGPYRPIERLGRGGMGTVFLVERDDPSFRNRVALKLLRRGVDTEDVLHRFRAERRILASLHYPGIATVFDVGTSADGRPYLVMEYVDGEPLVRHCEARALDVPARLRLFMAVLRAVSHAHAHGIVHRDLKPGNILVTRDEAHVKLLDFGIAKILDPAVSDDATPPTAPDTRPMTPGFASPEQVLGLPITEASDIYQLGVLLHELLTGVRPLEGLTPKEYERRVATTDPTLPSRAARTLPDPVPVGGVSTRRDLSRLLAGDLDAIILRCLQRDPADRYPSVDELHRDVVRYLDGRPVAARRATRTYRLEKLVRRRARALALPAVALVAVLMSAVALSGVISPGDLRDDPAPATAGSGLDFGGRGVSGASTDDPGAHAFFVEGLDAFWAGDDRVADRFFHAALDEDTTFALAAYYASRATRLDQPEASTELLNRAYRLAERAPDRDRLMIRARWAEAMEHPSLALLADSLARQFPDEAEGHYLRGQVLVHGGQFVQAFGSLERAIALDSSSLHASTGPCVACDAFGQLIRAQWLADSIPAAVRSGERWARLQPESALPWHYLAISLLHAERPDEALAANARAADLRVGNLLDPLFPGIVAVHQGDFEAADRLFRVHVRTGTPRMQIQAAHWLAISLRTQGRWRDARGAADALLNVARARPAGDRHDVLGNLAKALALLGSGNAIEAAELFEASIHDFDEYTASRNARNNAWILTQAGTARAAAGDTAALASLVERVEAEGARSIYGRDQRLHHYLRGLLARARGAPESEVGGHLRAAVYSLPHGYARINLELGESLLRQGRYEEAAAVAGAALRNSMESNGMYNTRTDVHELLGRIWHAAGERDSAVVHLRAARDAWRDADPIMAPRIAEIDRLLDATR